MNLNFLSILVNPKKIYRFIDRITKYKKYDLQFHKKKQVNIYKKNKIDRNKGLKKIDYLKKKHSYLFDKIFSEHNVIFSSMSLCKSYKFKNILEIGTYNGKNAAFLSKLFPNSKIDTFDLPDNHSDFINTYRREDMKIRTKFINERNKLIQKFKNITFFKKNSITLMLIKKKYDLIWIDGAHGYPVFTIDFVNSLNLLRKNGVILCDDVILKNKFNDKFYNSSATYETLSLFAEEKIIKFSLFYKRLNVESNYENTKIKFIALVRKI